MIIIFAFVEGCVEKVNETSILFCSILLRSFLFFNSPDPSDLKTKEKYLEFFNKRNQLFL